MNYDGELDEMSLKLAQLEREVASLVDEVSRLRNAPDLAGRLGDLERQVSLLASDQELSRRLSVLERLVQLRETTRGM